MNRHKTRYERRMARAVGITRAVGLVLCAALVAALWWTVARTDEPPKETDRWAQFAAQEEYYRVMELYGDADGATEAARVVFEREVNHAED